MAVEASTPVPWRPSEAERERAVRALRERQVEGRLSLDTFSRRVERAYAARNRDQLEELLADLPGRGLVRRVLTAVTARTSALAAEVQAAWREPRTPRLALPPADKETFTIGRGPDCDCVIVDGTVSRRHAALHRNEEGWTLRDLGSTNGTRLNGWRLIGETEVHPGDRVTFGSARYRLTSPFRR